MLTLFSRRMTVGVCPLRFKSTKTIPRLELQDRTLSESETLRAFDIINSNITSYSSPEGTINFKSMVQGVQSLQDIGFVGNEDKLERWYDEYQHSSALLRKWSAKAERTVLASVRSAPELFNPPLDVISKLMKQGYDEQAIRARFVESALKYRRTTPDAVEKVRENFNKILQVVDRSGNISWPYVKRKIQPLRRFEEPVLRAAWAALSVDLRRTEPNEEEEKLLRKYVPAFTGLSGNIDWDHMQKCVPAFAEYHPTQLCWSWEAVMARGP
eukprot:Rmarinus@m.14531